MLRALGVALLPYALASTPEYTEDSIRFQYCAGLDRIGDGDGKCNRSPYCDLIKDGSVRACIPKGDARSNCEGYTAELSNQNKCNEETLGECYFDTESQKCKQRKKLPEECRPCTGFPHDLCHNLFTQKDCNAVERNENQYCNWWGWRNGYKCYHDLTPCREMEAGSECDTHTWGECTVERDTCEKRSDEHKERCKPCIGPGICTEITDIKTCRHFKMQDLDCNWQGYHSGTGCTDEVAGYSCWTMGDPHIRGFEPDVDKWTFMGVGDYMFVDSARMVAHVRQQETRKETISSNVGFSFFGPDYPCKGGTETCSNTCGYTYELHIGHRMSNTEDGEEVVYGDFLYEPTLIIHNVAGESPEYWVYTGVDDITAALTDGTVCENISGLDVTKGGNKYRTEDSMILEFYDGSEMRLSQWSHPEWGMALYFFLNDWGDYKYFNPALSNNEGGLCNMECNPVQCDKTMFTYFPDPQYEGSEDLTTRYAGISQPYADFRNKAGWCEAMTRTDCDLRPDVVKDCPEDIRTQAELLCDGCPQDIIDNCVFDSCAAGDISFALEYTGTCNTVTAPVTAPVTPPTWEPTPSPTSPQCGATFSPICQQNSMECGVKGAYFHGYNRKLIKPTPMFSISMRMDTEAANTCSCEQFCLVKGGKWWILKEPRVRVKDAQYFTFKKPIKEDCSHFNPAKLYTCECYWADDVRKISVNPSSTRVRKAVLRGERRGGHWGGVVSVLAVEEDFFDV